ncbi:TPA: hypothetical protein U1D11_000505 [Streptococcus suis]|nr:hypothetical protein [Streptococcus suis]
MSTSSFLAWHGTTQSFAKKIRIEGFEKTTIDFSAVELRNPNDLGGGVYFYIDSVYSRGLTIATKYAHNYRDKIAKKQRCSIEIIEVTIDVQSHLLLDLNDKKTEQMFVEFSQKHEAERNKIKGRLRNDGASRRRNYDGIMVELFVHHINKQLPDGEVQAVQKYTHTSFDGVISNFPNGAELCVRDVSCIKLQKKEKKVYGDEFKRFL